MRATIITLEVCLCILLYYLDTDCGALTLTANTFPKSDIIEDLKLKTSRKTSIQHEPPQYMLDLYNEIADIDGATKRPLPYQAKIARALSSTEDRPNEYRFSIAGVPSDEKIIEAEFHIYHHQLKNRQRKLNFPRNMYKLTLYAETSSGPILVSTHELTNHAFGWRIFSVGNILKKIRARRGTHVTFSFRAETDEGVPLHLEIYHRSYGPKAPLLVMFNKNNNSSSSQLLFPNLHKDSGIHQGSRKKRDVFEDYSDNLIETTLAKLDGCELVPMKVNFQDIGWSSWIVYPTEYNAHQCMGGCTFPLGQDLDPTNHATVQSILHFSKTMSSVQHPSCVPTSYTSLTLLYYDEEENVILKQFDHMIATTCGCR